MLKATIVFEKNWDAINAKDANGNQLYRYIINRGSSRSSKTYSLIDCHDLYARSQKNKRITLWRDTKIDTKKTILNDMIKRLKSTGRYKVGNNFNKTESIFTYDTDSTVEAHGTDDDETVHGLTQDCAHFNEPYKISRETFDQIDQRTSDFVFIDYNPKKGHWVEDLMKDPRSIVIDSTFKDNPFCPPEQRLKILSYQPVSMCEVVESKLLHESDAFEYDLALNPLQFTERQLNELIRCRENEDKNSSSAFNWSVYGLGKKSERPNRIYTWQKIALEDYKKIECKTIVCTDWGKVDPWAIVEMKYDDGKVYVRQLNYRSENEIRLHLKPTELIQMQGDENGLVVWMFNKLGVDKSCEIIADNNRPLKIAILRRFGYQCFAANKAKNSIIDGIDLLQNLDVYYTVDSEDIEYEQENYSYKVDSHGVVLEEPEDLNNHTMDSIRYGSLYLQARGIIKKA